MHKMSHFGKSKSHFSENMNENVIVKYVTVSVGFIFFFASLFIINLLDSILVRKYHANVIEDLEKNIPKITFSSRRDIDYNYTWKTFVPMIKNSIQKSSTDIKLAINHFETGRLAEFSTLEEKNSKNTIKLYSFSANKICRGCVFDITTNKILTPKSLLQLLVILLLCQITAFSIFFSVHCKRFLKVICR